MEGVMNVVTTAAMTAGYFGIYYITDKTKPSERIVFPGSAASNTLSNLNEKSSKPELKNSNEKEWNNTVVSLAHAVISTVILIATMIIQRNGAAFSYLWYYIGLGGETEMNMEEMKYALLNESNLLLKLCVMNSLAFFLHDQITFIINGWWNTSRMFLTIHHSLIIICYGLSILENKYLPILSLTLLAEANSIFMHIRKLCILLDEKNSRLYNLISLFLVSTYVPSRTIPHFVILGITWAVRAYFHKTFDFTLAFMGMIVLNFLNAYFLSKFMNTDVFRKSLHVLSSPTKKSSSSSPSNSPRLSS